MITIMGTISQLKKQNLPQWAQQTAKRAEQAIQSAESGTPGDSAVDIRAPKFERNTNEISHLREEFISFRQMDENPDFDSAIGQTGLVIPPGSSAEIHFSGNSLNGQVEIVSSSQYTRYDYQGHEVSYNRIRKDGNFQAGRLKLNSPQTSFQISSQSLDKGSVEVPKSSYFEATTNGREALSEIPQGSEAALFRELFLDGTKSMVKARANFLHDLDGGLQQADIPAEDKKFFKSICDNPTAATPRLMGAKLHELVRANPGNKELKELREKAGLWQALEDFPKLKADGIMRTSQYYVTPQLLNTRAAAQGWDFDKKTGLPIADSVIVGGGPGGLSSAYHLSERGTRTVLFEAGFVGQGFSDAGAQSVHQLRTNGAASNLIYTANGNQLGVDVSMQRHLAENRSKCHEAREDWAEASKEPLHGLSQARGSEVNFAANRSELFEHMSQVAHGLALNYPDTLVSEASPVSSIEKIPGSDGEAPLYKVSTYKGHEILARSLVMATGFVGGDGEHARSLGIFQKLEDTPKSGVTVLPNDHDLFSDNDTIESDLLVFSERLLGRPEIRERIKEMPEGSRIAVIGGGESATKGALEALSLNPGVSLDLYTSGALAPYQTQVPTSTIAHGVTEAAIRHQEVAQKTIDSLKGFGTPVTSETLQELFEYEAEGRVRIHEFGKRFDDNSVSVEVDNSGERARLNLQLKDPEVAQNLRKQRQEWLNSGLYPTPPEGDPTQLPQADMVMVAAGYDKKSMKAGPLLQQLEAQGLVELTRGGIEYGEDGLTSSKDPMVAFNTAGAVAMASDTAIPGRAIRAYRLAQLFDQKLPAREKPEDRIESGLEYDGSDTQSKEELFNWNKEQALAYIENKGIYPENIAQRQAQVDTIEDPAERASAQLRLDASVRFPGPNSALRALMIRAHEAPESLSPAEKLMWERAQAFEG